MADISDLPVPGKTDISDLPPPPKQESFGESYVRPTTDVLNRSWVAGTLGAPVDIATMVMRPFGYKEEAPVGGSEWIGKQMEKAGVVSPTRRPVAEFLTGVAPSLVTGGAAATRAAVGAGKKALDFYNLSKGQEAEKASKALSSALPEIAGRAKGIIGEQESAQSLAERLKRSRQETGLRGAEEKFTTAARAERESSAARLADMGKSQDPATLGEEMQRRLVGTEATRESRRSQRATEDAAAYFDQARGKGDFTSSNEGKSFVSFLRNQLFSERVTPAERKIAEGMYADLAAAKDIEAVEKTFRRYNEASKGLPKEGYDAVLQQYAGKVSDELSSALNKFAPKRKEFRDTYKDLSSPLDAYETSFGAKGVAREKAVPERVQMMASDYPNRYFKNRDTVNSLREQLAGDEAAVRKFATQHAVNELSGKNASQAQKWLDDNRSWVDAVPGLNDRVKRYVYEIAQSEKKAGTLTEQAGKVAAKRGKVVEARETREADIASKAQEQRAKLDNELDKLKYVSPKDVPATAGRILQYIRANKLLPENELLKLQSDINNVVNVYGETERASRTIDQAIRRAVGWGITGGVGFGIYQAEKK